MDPNLDNIAHENRFAIRNGSIGKVCEQAENYLTYVLGHNYKAIQQEMDDFVIYIKKMRRRNRGKRQQQEGQTNQRPVQRIEAPPQSST